MKRKKIFLLPLFVLLLVSCNTSQQTASPATPHPLVLTLPANEQAPGTIPLSEAGVPRISAADAKAAFDSGKAILVDVRSPDAYANSHAEGAINIPLGYFEADITKIPLEKDQWIITYCT